MPASRPYWKGYLKLSFVSRPVALYPAISAAERVSFRQVNRRTGHRLKQKLIDSVTGQAIEAADKARGYEVGENEFLLVEDRDLEQARRERWAPGEVELATPLRRQSPPTVPASLHDDAAKERADIKNDRKDIRSDRRDIHRDDKDIHSDKRDAKRDTADIRHDRRRARRIRRDVHHDEQGK